MQKIKNGPEKKCFDLRSQFFVCELGLAIGRYGLTFLLLSSLFPKKSHPNQHIIRSFQIEFESLFAHNDAKSYRVKG